MLMFARLKRLFNSALALQEAARENSVKGCARAFDKTSASTNSLALRIAAENKAYDVFEYMLTVASKDEDSLSRTHDFAFGSDWDRVQQLAKTDARLGAALARYDADMETAAAVDPMLTVLKSQGFDPQ
jgi:hypothetical protein